MEGVKDGEPPSKRLRLSCAGSSNLSRCSSSGETAAAGSSEDLMAEPMQYEEEERMIGPRGIVKKIEFIRLIAGALYEFGYNNSVAHLEDESGIKLQSVPVNLLTQHVNHGRWDESVSALQNIGLKDESKIKLAELLILELKFFELLDDGKLMDALNTLKTELVPLGIDTSIVIDLTSRIICYKKDCYKKGPLKASAVLDELQKLLCPAMIVPSRRLEYLVEQALVSECRACLFHNLPYREISLYSDHHCGKDYIPSRTLQILEKHEDEVWFLQFSHNGKYIASASSDHSAIIWEVGVSGEFALKHRLFGHQRPVSLVSWRRDDEQLLTCGTEENVRRWNVVFGECLQIYEKDGINAISCAWSPDGESVFTGFSDKSICMWDLTGNELNCWKENKTLKISDLQLTCDGKKIISTGVEAAILLLNIESKEEKWILEDQPITSFSISDDGKFLLVDLLNEEINLFAFDGDDAKHISTHSGHKRSRFVVRSCLGGFEQSFIASGSEDSQVYIWHRSSEDPILVLPGHSGTVNCVSWNPINHHMLATASDDRTIRIWGLNSANIR